MALLEEQKLPFPHSMPSGDAPVKGLCSGALGQQIQIAVAVPILKLLNTKTNGASALRRPPGADALRGLKITLQVHGHSGG